MSTRIRRRTRTEDSFADDAFTLEDLDGQILDDVSDDEIEAFLSSQEEEKEQGFWNLPTVAGLSIITFGIAYLFLNVLGAKHREWNLFVSGAAAGMSLILMSEARFW